MKMNANTVQSKTKFEVDVDMQVLVNISLNFIDINKTKYGTKKN